MAWHSILEGIIGEHGYRVMNNDELLSKTISYLRFPLTAGIVFIHFSLAKGLSIHGVKHGLENPEWFFFLVNLISDVLSRIGVPLFFIISGFLFFYQKDFDGNVYKLKLKSRFKSLLIPYILWNVIAIIWQLKCFLPGISSFFRPVEVHLSFVRIINTFLCNMDNSGIFVGSTSTEPTTGLYPIDIPLWYVRDLMVMAVFSPIIYWLIKKTRQWFILTIGFIWFFSSIILPEGSYFFIYTGMFVTATFFFSLGAFYSINKENIVLCFRKIKYSPIVYVPIAIADALTKGLEFNFYIHKIGILIGVFAAIVVVSYLLESNRIKVNSSLANSSFFIFALHSLFIEDIGKFAFIMLHIPENNPYAMLTLYFSVPIFSILVCLILYLLLRRNARGVCNLLTGGR